MKIAAGIGLVVAGLLAAALLALYGVFAGWFGAYESAGEIRGGAVPASVLAARATEQRAAARARGASTGKQILFGDLHVHTTFSFDAFLLSLPMLGGPGAHPPADACDFARYCSGLDFWSINDHAENLTRPLWERTVAAVRQCNEVAGDPDDPDLVTYLGWEWSQIGLTPDTHYGHRNVVLLGTAEAEIPSRPIGARSRFTSFRRGLRESLGPVVLALANGERGRDFAHLVARNREAERCPAGVPVRELPVDCLETTATPQELIAKLRDWNVPAMVIPHGTSWGFYTPAGSNWAKQLATHDPGLETLVEIYSGHGNSEEYRDFRAVDIAPDGSLSCPAPSAGYLPSCWRAGELVQARCLEIGELAAECERRASAARQHYVEAFQAGWLTARGHPPNSWLDAGQCTDCFQPAFNYRPLGSVQYMLALRSFDDPAEPRGFDFGFVGSSDGHSARPGTGYKEFWRGEMTEGRGADPGGPSRLLVPRPVEPAAESQPFDYDTSEQRLLALFENERASAYFVTGGLVAAHSEGRDRRSIFEALGRREVYGTSGPRILLWFDLLDESGEIAPMGSKRSRSTAPLFRVRAVGSLEQQPGCPSHARSALGSDRLARLCAGECHHPSDERRLITRIEVVRIRRQLAPGEPVGGLIEDPWRRFDCPAYAAGCQVEFEDRQFAEAGRDTVYYVRAIEEPSQAIRGADPLNCRRDAAGRCLEVEPCSVRTPRSDDCLQETEQRAWSSPIFVDYPDA